MGVKWLKSTQKYNTFQQYKANTYKNVWHYAKLSTRLLEKDPKSDYISKTQFVP